MNKTVHYVGLDVHKETIAVAIAPAENTEVRLYGIINGTLDALDKLVKKLQQPGVQLRFVYEAGPCGYVIYRHLKKKGLHCDVVAPSLIPKKASDRVKTDRRDAQQLARLYRAGELTAIYVPEEEDEAVRDLVRARQAAVIDQRKARQRLKGFLLRLGFRYTGKTSWNDAHQRYLAPVDHASSGPTDRLPGIPGGHQRRDPAIGATDPGDAERVGGLEVGARGAGVDEFARRASDRGHDPGGRSRRLQPV